MAQHRYQVAIETYTQVKDPSAKLWDRIGVAYELLLNSDDAIRCYKKSLEMDPNNARALNDLATVYDQLQRHRQAERLYRRAIEIAPTTGLYFKNLGTNLVAQHQFGKGSKAYQQALALDPHTFDNHGYPLMVLPPADHAEINYARARSCAQLGLRDCALDYLRKALDEGSATAKRIASDGQFESMRNDPSLQLLLMSQP